MDYDALSRISTLRTKLAYIPFLGGVGGYRIGVEPLEGPWLIADEDRHVQLAMKQALLMHKCESYRHTHASYQARLEAAKLLCDEMSLPKGTNLHGCSAAIQDDLAIMEKDALGQWRMSAASICFPSSWILKDKFDQTSHVIHAQVGDDKFRNAIDASLDNVTEEIVERFNWTLTSDFTLRHPEDYLLSSSNYDVESLTKHNAGSKLFVRYERQTLRRLPETGAVLFTIRVFVDPLRHLKEEHPQHILDFLRAYKRHKTQGSYTGAMFEYLGVEPTWPMKRP